MRISDVTGRIRGGIAYEFVFTCPVHGTLVFPYRTAANVARDQHGDVEVCVQVALDAGRITRTRAAEILGLPRPNRRPKSRRSGR